MKRFKVNEMIRTRLHRNNRGRQTGLALFVLGSLLGLVWPLMSTADATTLPDHIEPIRVTAEWREEDVFARISFWNVGGLKPGYEAAIIEEYFPFGDGPHEISRWEGTFSGGPDGIFTSDGWTTRLVNGEYIMAYDGDVKLMVRNPEAFDNWDRVDSGVSFSDIYGEVYIYPADDPDDFYFAELDSVLHPGDRVVTKGDSGVILSLRDMTTFEMSPNSMVQIGDSSEDGTHPLSLLLGHIFVNVERMLDDGSMDIEMSQAVAGIKGTSLIASEDGNTSTVNVLSGLVEVTPKTGRPVDLRAGQSVSSTRQGLGSVSAFTIEEALDPFDTRQRARIQREQRAEIAQLQGTQTPAAEEADLLPWEREAKAAQPLSEIDRLMARADAGDMSAILDLLDAFEDGEPTPFDGAQILEWLQAVAETGQAKAQLILGVTYLEGLPDVPEDLDKAFHWVRLAAEQGNADSQAILGGFYLAEPGREDYIEAHYWLQRSASAGNPLGQYLLGLQYAEGFGVPENPEEAVRLWRLSAEQGDESAAYELAHAYEDGFGIAASRQNALRWFREAEALGHPEAAEDIARISGTR